MSTGIIQAIEDFTAAPSPQPGNLLLSADLDSKFKVKDYLGNISLLGTQGPTGPAGSGTQGPTGPAGSGGGGSITGTPSNILYFGPTGSVYTDDLFYRDPTTYQTLISRSFGLQNTGTAGYGTFPTFNDEFGEVDPNENPTELLVFSGMDYAPSTGIYYTTGDFYTGSVATQFSLRVDTAVVAQRVYYNVSTLVGTMTGSCTQSDVGSGTILEQTATSPTASILIRLTTYTHSFVAGTISCATGTIVASSVDDYGNPFTLDDGINTPITNLMNVLGVDDTLYNTSLSGISEFMPGAWTGTGWAGATSTHPLGTWSYRNFEEPWLGGGTTASWIWTYGTGSSPAGIPVGSTHLVVGENYDRAPISGSIITATGFGIGWGQGIDGFSGVTVDEVYISAQYIQDGVSKAQSAMLRDGAFITYEYSGAGAIVSNNEYLIPFGITGSYLLDTTTHSSYIYVMDSIILLSLSSYQTNFVQQGIFIVGTTASSSITIGNYTGATNSPYIEVNGTDKYIQSSGSLRYTVSNVSSETYSILPGDYIIGLDTRTFGPTVSLPETPSQGDVYIIKDTYGSASVNTFTITTTATGSNTIDGTYSKSYSSDHISVSLVYNQNSSSWMII